MERGPLEADISPGSPAFTGGHDGRLVRGSARFQGNAAGAVRALRTGRSNRQRANGSLLVPDSKNSARFTYELTT